MSHWPYEVETVMGFLKHTKILFKILAVIGLVTSISAVGIVYLAMQFKQTDAD